MTPTDILKNEHELIVKVLDAAEQEARQIGTNNAVNADRVEKMLDFFRHFADGCHHAKEEQHLFPRLQRRGLPLHGGPVAVMLHDHEAGRQFLRAMAAAVPGARQGEAKAVDEVRNNLTGYVELLRHHIMKENNVLFPTADRVLTEEDQRELLAGFEKVEAEEVGAGVHEKYHRLAHEILGGK
jgi:hemerythrin-like domain-containing protein